MLKAVNNLKFNVAEIKLLDWNETYDEIQGDTNKMFIYQCIYL